MNDGVDARLEFHTYPNGSYVAALVVEGEETPLLACLCGNFAKIKHIREKFENLCNEAMLADIDIYNSRN